MSETQKSPVTTLVLVLLLVATIGVLFAMFANALSVYFVLEGTPRVTQSAIITYQVLTGFALALTIAGIVVGFARHRAGFGITNIGLFLVVLIAATVFSVPQYNSDQKPQEHHLPSNYTPCFSGSGNCAGG
jgi:hypothetical protein